MIIGHRIRKEHIVVVVQEDNDDTPHTNAGFFFSLRNALQEQGYDTVKALMEQDGYLEDPDRFYVRDQKYRWCVVDPRDSIRPTYAEYEDRGYVCLELQQLDIDYELPVIGNAYNLLYPQGVEIHED